MLSLFLLLAEEVLPRVGSGEPNREIEIDPSAQEGARACFGLEKKKTRLGAAAVELATEQDDNNNIARAPIGRPKK